MFKNRAIMMVVFFTALLALGVFSVFVVPSIMKNPCKNEILHSEYSPNRKIKAIIFWRNCGANSGINTQVSLLENDEDLENKSGNLFVADTDNGKAPKANHGGPKVDLRWLYNNKIKLSYQKDVMVFKHESVILGVTIEYSPHR